MLHFDTGSFPQQPPLYAGAPLSTEESLFTTYLYAIKNKLSYEAIAQLIELIQLHIPSPNSFPRSVYMLKKHVSDMATQKIQKYCSLCFEEIPNNCKQCSRRACKQVALSYYAVLPIEDHLQEIFKGIITLLGGYARIGTLPFGGEDI